MKKIAARPPSWELRSIFLASGRGGVYLSRKRCVFLHEISTLSSTGATKAATGARASAKLSFISFYPFLMLSPQNPEGSGFPKFWTFLLHGISAVSRRAEKHTHKAKAPAVS